MLVRNDADPSRALRLPDRGARNLVSVFLVVAAILVSFNSYLVWRSLHWSPMLFIEHAGSSRSRVVIAGEPRPEPAGTAVSRGRELYRRSACALCHGPAGKGGVIGPNYVKEVMPGLDRLAERLFLQEREDADGVIRLLEAGKPLTAAQLDLPRAAAVVAQIQSVRDVVLKGNPGGKKESAGVTPIDMPPWKDKLSPRDVDDLIAYLVSLYPWKDSDH